MIVCLIFLTIILNVSDFESMDSNHQQSRFTKTNNGLVGILAVIATLCFVVFFALGPGPVPWIITGEFYTQTPRSAAVALGTFANWSGNLAVGLIFPQIQLRMPKFSFLPFTIALILLFLVLFFYMPDTKGIPVTDIESLFQVIFQ